MKQEERSSSRDSRDSRVQILWNAEKEWTRKKIGIHIDTHHGGSHEICSFKWDANHRILSLMRAVESREEGKVHGLGDRVRRRRRR